MKFLKKHIRVVIVLCVLILHTAITYPVNYNRISNNKSPLFLFPGATAKDGGTKHYYGIGYQVIDWNELGGKKGFEINTPFSNKFFQHQ